MVDNRNAYYPHLKQRWEEYRAYYPLTTRAVGYIESYDIKTLDQISEMLEDDEIFSRPKELALYRRIIGYYSPFDDSTALARAARCFQEALTDMMAEGE